SHGNATHNIGDVNNNGLLDPGETWQFTSVGVVTRTAQAGQYTNNAVVTGKGKISGNTVTAQNPDNYFGSTPSSGTLAGLTLGFWKTHPDAAVWGPSGLLPTDPLSKYFLSAALINAGIDPSTTLLDALNAHGGGI